MTKHHLVKHVIDSKACLIVWQGVFNKEAMIIKMLAESSANEVAWMWWVDIDTLIVNATAGPPLDNYVDQDFVAWGHAETLLKGDMQNGA